MQVQSHVKWVLLKMNVYNLYYDIFLDKGYIR